MLSATMRSALAQALRQCARGQPPRSLQSRVALVRRSFLVTPSYKSTVAVRGFATATAKKTTGGTAAKAATKTKAAPKAKAATKTKAAPKAKKTATKAKKTAKAPAKKKAAAKPKKPVVRKKELSPEKKEVMLRRELKRVSLISKEPKNLPATRWLVFVSKSLKDQPSTGLADTQKRFPTISAEFKALSPAELERMEETAAQNKAINAGNFRTWVESHSPAEIDQANRARRRLKRDFNISAHPLKIHDHRLPKRPSCNGYSYYVKAKRGGGSFELLSKELGDEWRALPAAEKKPYEDLAVAEFAKYKQEMEKVYSA